MLMSSSKEGNVTVYLVFSYFQSEMHTLDWVELSLVYVDPYTAALNLNPLECVLV